MPGQGAAKATPGATVAGAALASLAAFVESTYGKAGLLAEVGLPEPIGRAAGAPGGDDERFPAGALVALLAAAERATGDPLLGLKLATTQDPRRLGVLAYATSNRPTLGAALGNAVRYLALWNEGLAPHLAPRDGGGVALRFEPRGLGAAASDAGLRQLILLAAPTSLALARGSTGVRPLALAFGADALALPVVGADPTLYAIVTRHADELLARPEASSAGPWAARVRAHVVTTLGRGEVELGAAARPRAERAHAAAAAGRRGHVVIRGARRRALRARADLPAQRAALALGGRRPARLPRPERILPGVLALGPRHARRVSARAGLTRATLGAPGTVFGARGQRPRGGRGAESEA